MPGSFSTRRLLSSLTGATRHWRATHGRLGLELRAGTSPFEPRTQAVLGEMLTTAGVLLTYTVGPYSEIDFGVKASELKLLTTEHFREAYAAILASFYSMLPPTWNLPQLAPALRLILPTDDKILELERFLKDVPDFEPKHLANHVALMVANALEPLELDSSARVILWQPGFSTLYMGACLEMMPQVREASQE